MYTLIVFLAAAFVVGYSQDLDAVMVGIYGVPYPKVTSVKTIDNKTTTGVVTDKPSANVTGYVSKGTVALSGGRKRQRRQAGLIGTIERGDECVVRGQIGRCVYYGECGFNFHANGSWYWQEAVKLCKIVQDVCCPMA